MLALFLSVLALAGTPAAGAEPAWGAPIDQPAFCRDLKAMIAASADTPFPFASVTRPGEEQKAQWSPTANLNAFGSCQITRYGGQPGLQCIRYGGGPLAKSRAEAVDAVRQCTGVEPLPAPADPLRRDRETLFETQTWTLTISESGCDRCRGMPSVWLWLERR